MLSYPAGAGSINTYLDAPGRNGTKMSPRKPCIFPRGVVAQVSIPQTRAALSTMASSTGCTAVGERLMMPSTSAVAV